MLTKEEVEQSLPGNLKSAATQALTDRINTACSDPQVAEQIRDNFISYTTVLKDGRYKTEDYLNAVTYVTYKLMDLSNLEAYQRTFPNRYQALVSKGTSSKDIAAYVSAYNKGKLVNAILEQTLIPVHILNQAIYQKAINQQAWLMKNAQSEKVQSDAANSILTHLAKPKETAAGIQVDVNVGSGMDELKDMLTRLASKQREAIESGVPTEQIAAQPLIEGKVKELKDGGNE